MNRKDAQEYRRKLKEINQEYRDKLRALKLIYGVTEVPDNKSKESLDNSRELQTIKIPYTSIYEGSTAVAGEPESVAGMARAVIVSLGPKFTVLDLRKAIKDKFGKEAPLSNLSHFLKRQAVAEFGLEIVEPGRGKRPTMYRNPSATTEYDMDALLKELNGLKP